MPRPLWAGSRELRAVVGGCWRANTRPETSPSVVNTYLYKAEAALFSPLGLLGLGSPAMLMSARKGQAAVTWHIPKHLYLYLGTELGWVHTALPQRNELSHTPHPSPSASGTSGAHSKVNKPLHLANLLLFLSRAPCHSLSSQHLHMALSAYTNPGELSWENSVW